MGIHGLTKLIADKAPGAIKEHKMDSYFGRKIAVDASMSIYQFLIAVRQGEQGQLLATDLAINFPTINAFKQMLSDKVALSKHPRLDDFPLCS